MLASQTRNTAVIQIFVEPNYLFIMPWIGLQKRAGDREYRKKMAKVRSGCLASFRFVTFVNKSEWMAAYSTPRKTASMGIVSTGLVVDTMALSTGRCRRMS